MSLVADYSTTSSSSQSESSNDSVTDNDLNQEQQNISPGKDSGHTTVKPVLPSANLVLGGTSKTNSKRGEVFNNPFREAENAKTALLEKHVKMVNKKEHITEKNGRKICWNNRKGRCRFGSNCHYAHDSDLSVAAELNNAVDPGHSNQTNQLANSNTAKKRKRPGLSDSIQPCKRVIKAYHQQTQTQMQRKT